MLTRAKYFSSLFYQVEKRTLESVLNDVLGKRIHIIPRDADEVKFHTYLGQAYGVFSEDASAPMLQDFSEFKKHFKVPNSTSDGRGAVNDFVDKFKELVFRMALDLAYT